MSEIQPEQAASAPPPSVLAINQLLAMLGPVPPQGGNGPAPAAFTIGMIQSFAGLDAAFGAPVAAGQLVGIPMDTALFAVFRTYFGGNGTTSFGLPSLVGVTAIGGWPGTRGPGTLGMTYLVATEAGG